MNEPASGAGEPALPWIRLAGAVVLGFLVIEMVTQMWFISLSERLDELEPFEDRIAVLERLQLVGLASSGVIILSGGSVAVIMLAAARRLQRFRVPAALAGLAFAAVTASSLGVVAESFRDPQDAYDPMTGWFQFSALACGVVWGCVMALALGLTRGRPRRGLALGCIAVAAAWVLLHVYGAFMLHDGPPPSWWSENVLGMRVPSWIHALGTLGLGLGLWSIGSPAGADEGPRFDAAAVEGLRLAQIVVWWRAGLAACSVLGLIAVSMVPSKGSTSWIVEASPWLGYVELGLGALMVVCLAAVVLQLRSVLAAALVGAGTLLLLATTVGSFGLNVQLHQVVHNMGSDMGSIGGAMRRYAETVSELDSLLRGLGLAGMLSVLAGLIILARRCGSTSQLRAFRFMGFVALLTSTVLFGREVLAELGMGLLLLTPVIIGAVIWMLLDLVTFLGEVADGLERSS